VTEMSEHRSDPRGDIDRLLRDTLRDDLPPEVQARLERRVQRFVESRNGRRRRPNALRFVQAPSQSMVALAAGLLLACGLGLQARSGPDGLAESLSDVSALATLVRAVRGATFMSCVGFEDAALASPAALADHLYRRWVLQRSRSNPDGAVDYEFLARDELAVYDVISRDLSPPREIRKRPLATAAQSPEARPGEVALCRWEAPPTAMPGLVFLLGR